LISTIRLITGNSATVKGKLEAKICIKTIYQGKITT
jgi:hypothetical protein